MAQKKVKVKVKKKKINKKRTLITLLTLILIVLIMAYIINIPVKNIYISGTTILNDKEIIELSNINKNSTYIETYFSGVKSKLLENEYIKEVRIKRKLFSKIYIEIEEYKPLCIYQEKLVLSSSEQVENTYNIDHVPYITNNISDIYDEFIKSFNKVDDDILVKISHIEYKPNEVDKERFILYMIDSNYVYITLSKIEKINKYNSIVKELEGKKGIIYLDSGDYVEIKD